MNKVYKNRKLRRMCAVMAVFIFCIFALAPGVYATESDSDEVADESEEITTGQDVALEAPEQEQNAESEEVHTFLSRIQEWFETNLVEFFGAANLATALSIITSVIVSYKKKKSQQAISDSLLISVQEKTDSNTAINAEVVKAINSLIEKYNGVQIYIEALDAKERERDAVCNEMILFSRTVLEILATVYANNANVPQGVKDLVNLKYANALKSETGVEVFNSDKEI